MMNNRQSIPSLFPNALQDICKARVLQHLIQCGVRVEELVKSRSLASTGNQRKKQHQQLTEYGDREAMRRRHMSFFPWNNAWPQNDIDNDNKKYNNNDNRDSLFTRSEYFIRSVAECQQFLVNFVASHVHNDLIEATRGNRIDRPGQLFCFAVLCNERLSRLVACHREEGGNQNVNDSLDGNANITSSSNSTFQDWSTFLSSPLGSDLFLNCLSQLSGLSALILHEVCTNEMLYIVADTCCKLQTLDISYSYQVSDLGLTYLCGDSPGVVHNSSHPVQIRRPPAGCRYLREFKLNPHDDLSNGPHILLRPRIVAYLLRHLPLLEVVDLEQLHDGIVYYCRGNGGFGPRHLSYPSYSFESVNINPLKLVHFTGTDLQLSNVMHICPKLRTFKIFVSSGGFGVYCNGRGAVEAALTLLGETLQKSQYSLQHVTLVFGPQHATLVGLEQFLQACGSKLNSLELDCSPETRTSLADVACVARCCPFLETLCYTHFRLDPMLEMVNGEFPQLAKPAPFPFLTHLKLSDIRVECYGKEVFRFLLGGCGDVEQVFLSFRDTAYFFSDFLLDDVLAVNPLGRLEKFILTGVSLTLISALRLISSRPKLHILGKLMRWDVEPSELDTFTQILRRANSLKLLQDIAIF